VLLPSVVRYLDEGRPSDRGDEARAQADGPREHHRVGQALHGPRLADMAAAGCPTASSTSRAWWRIDTRAGLKTPGRGVGRDPGHVLRHRAEDSFDGELVGAVITVPAYFDDAQRQATKDAARWPA
jgi:molecular chaperone HscA